MIEVAKTRKNAEQDNPTAQIFLTDVIEKLEYLQSLENHIFIHADLSSAGEIDV